MIPIHILANTCHRWSHYLVKFYDISSYVIIQDGTDPVPPSWIVQESQTSASSCSCPCSSWVARVSLFPNQPPDQNFWSDFFSVTLFLLIRYVAGWGSGIVNICVTFPVNKTMFRFKIIQNQMNWVCAECIFDILKHSRQQLHGISALSAFKQLRSEVLAALTFRSYI